MKLRIISYCVVAITLIFISCNNKRDTVRIIDSFNEAWRFSLTADSTAIEPTFLDDQWRELNVPHDWSIEGTFDEKNPSGVGGGALPGGIGWYRKTFVAPESYSGKKVFVEFDGVYRNSDVWLNGKHLGYRQVCLMHFPPG